MIQTERLSLKPWKIEDLDRAQAVYGDDEVMKYITGKAWTRDEQLGFIGKQAEHLELVGSQFWLVELRETGELIGHCGVKPCQIFRDDGTDLGECGAPVFTGRGRPQFELGYALARAHWKKGYALEAGRASIDYAFALHPALRRIVAVADPVNQASLKVMERLGFEPAGLVRYIGSRNPDPYPHPVALTVLGR